MTKTLEVDVGAKVGLMADTTSVLIRNAGGDWRVPSISSYQNERELQDILTIPGSGSLDLSPSMQTAP